MGKRDQLIYSAHLALKTSGGSFKARYNHLREVLRFVKALRELGFYVQKWSNLTNIYMATEVKRKIIPLRIGLNFFCFRSLITTFNGFAID